MAKPIILALDDDAQVLQALTRDLRQHFKQHYRILSTSSPAEALEALKHLKNRNEVVALFVVDQKMPEMLGVDFLVQARSFFPQAKRVLLTAYSDIEAAIRAINEAGLDYYLTKPWDPPEIHLYPILNDLLESWQADYLPTFQGVRVVGYQFSPRSHEIKAFLAGNLFPYEWLDVETQEVGRELLEMNQIATRDLPAIFFADGSYLTNPPLTEIAARIGLTPQASSELYDVVIIGAGPAGLAAAVYGASEGLNTLLIERRAPGGQAGTSSKIENYLGFHTGISGSELTRRAITQAKRLGAEFLAPQQVRAIESQDGYKTLYLEDDNRIHTRSVIIATGVDYRRLPADGADHLAGAGVYYGAAMTEAVACRGRDVYVVGGGNSAGQAAMYLSQFARQVSILIRSEDLTQSMSHYLIEQINTTPNITVEGRVQVVAAFGSDRLESIELEHLADEVRETRLTSTMFIFIGARPYTEWLPASILKNSRGFVETGSGLEAYSEFPKRWKQRRQPYLLETSVPGIFAAGDVRAGAMNRVASAVGEGAMAIKLVHEYLAGV